MIAVSTGLVVLIIAVVLVALVIGFIFYNRSRRRGRMIVTRSGRNLQGSSSVKKGRSR